MSIRVALLFEFGTLLGGERSMLAAIDELIRIGTVGYTCPPDGAPANGAGCGTLPQPANAEGNAPSISLVALAPGGGPLAEALRARGIEHAPFHFRDASQQRRPLDQLRGELIEHLACLRPHVLHANSLAAGRLSGAIAPLAHCACVAHLRDISRQSGAAIRELAGNHLLLAVSRATRDFHVGQGLPGERTRVLYNGIDCEHFRPRPRTGDLCRELGLPENAFLVLNVGQIGLRKGQDVLAAAAVVSWGAAELAGIPPGVSEFLRTPLPQTNLHYLIAGERYSAKRESVEFEQAIRSTFEAAGIGDRLHLLGYRDDVSFLMNEADLIVHAAHQEPLGRVLLEAAASGLPIIATDVGGTREILTDGETARLVPPGVAAALANAIVELHADRGLRERFATAARRHVCERFAIGRTARELAAVWREAARAPRFGTRSEVEVHVE